MTLFFILRQLTNRMGEREEERKENFLLKNITTLHKVYQFILTEHCDMSGIFFTVARHCEYICILTYYERMDIQNLTNGHVGSSRMKVI